MRMNDIKFFRNTIIFFLSAVVLLSCFGFHIGAGVAATSGTCGEKLTWLFEEETGVLRISGEGVMTNYERGSRTPWYGVYGGITSVVIEEGVASVGANAFANCESLERVDIGKSVIEIGANAFLGCVGLTQIDLPDSVKIVKPAAFAECFGLTKVTFSSKMTAIPHKMFYGFDAVMMNESRFSYNPETHAMEDVLLKPGALDAMAYIRNIYDNGWCPKTAFDTGAFADMSSFLASGKVGSFSMYQGRYREGSTTVDGLVKKAYNLTKLDWNELGDGVSEYVKWHEQTWVDTLLTGTRTKNVEVFSNSGGGYPACLMVGTPQPKETINFIIDLYFAADNNFIEAKQGIIGSMLIPQADGSFMVPYKDKAAGTYWGSQGWAALIGDVNPAPYPSGKVQVWSEDKRGPAQKRSEYVQAYKTGLDSAALAAGLVYTTKAEYFSPNTHSAQYVAYSGEADAYALAFILGGFTKGDSKSLDKLLEEYKANMRSIDGDLMLKQMNDAFGMVNNYQSYK